MRIPFILSCSFSLSACEGKKEAVKKKEEKHEVNRGERRERGVISLHFSLLWPRLKVQLQREKKKKRFSAEKLFIKPRSGRRRRESSLSKSGMDGVE